ncbi:hypothetical protein F2Q70_00015570 [Brassica cretica]|uniref:Uncharacterized protein n=1 Tax=Brassica cretica TaxID=69181 RepID=A0A8S9I240_BRACR|nr:hypothetical protein F2Q70_00015570 [Brassica cretica]KAF2600097.1 hypothetical protein F2Q68_00008516 [Brassica cretica]
MRSDTLAATNLKLIGCCLLYIAHDPSSFNHIQTCQFPTEFESAPREGSIQMNPSRPVSSFDDQSKVLSGVSSDQSVEACRFLHGEAKVCRSRDQFCPVKSRRPLGFGQVLSDQPAASRLEHWIMLGDFRPYRLIS